MIRDWFIVLVLCCFLARFRKPEDTGKGGTYMRKRLEVLRQREWLIGCYGISTLQWEKHNDKGHIEREKL